jgi:hypothetical protein
VRYGTRWPTTERDRSVPARGYGGHVRTSWRSRLLLPALLVLAAVGCSDVPDRVDDLRAEAEGVTDRGRFCLSVARTATAIESRATHTAVAAAEEALAQAPDELRDDARFVADRLRAARDGDDEALRDPELHETAERLRERTRELCDPTT